MTDREKVIKGLEMCIKDIECTGCPYEDECFDAINDSQFGENMMRDALALLKWQEGKVTVPFSWLVKFCSHIDFKEPMCDSEREQAWKEKLKKQFGIDV